MTFTLRITNNFISKLKDFQVQYNHSFVEHQPEKCTIEMAGTYKERFHWWAQLDQRITWPQWWGMRDTGVNEMDRQNWQGQSRWIGDRRNLYSPLFRYLVMFRQSLPKFVLCSTVLVCWALSHNADVRNNRAVLVTAKRTAQGCPKKRK